MATPFAPSLDPAIYHSRRGGFVNREVDRDVIPGRSQRDRRGGANAAVGAGDKCGWPEFVGWAQMRASKPAGGNGSEDDL